PDPRSARVADELRAAAGIPKAKAKPRPAAGSVDQEPETARSDGHRPRLSPASPQDR
ncbi:hypothetical protein LCGC14_3005050, partial [marine sediment metagenome]